MPQPIADANPSAPPRANAEPEDRGAYARLLWYAAAIRGAVSVLMYIVALGGVLLFFLGTRSGHAVEALVITVLALLQSGLALLGAHLLEEFAAIFIALAKDTQAVRQSLSKK